MSDTEELQAASSTELSGEDAEPSLDPEEEARLRDLAENNALARALDDVRAQSRVAQLVTPARFDELGLKPEHMTSEDFEMFVYSYLEEHLAPKGDSAAETPAERKPAEKTAPHVKSRFRSAQTTVGMPSWFNKAPEKDPMPSEAEKHEESEPEYVGPPGTGQGKRWDPLEGVLRAHPKPEKPQRAENPDDEVFGTLNVPDGYKLVRMDDQIVLVPKGEDDRKEERLEIDCEHIRVLTGKYTYYLYDDERMTDAYARWCFLAAEDDDEVTFAELVREESRAYPRPMSIRGLENEPFNKTADQIETIWEQVRDSGNYPDLKRATASNGDVYYFSTTYLSESYASSLAEWASVGRRMNM